LPDAGRTNVTLIMVVLPEIAGWSLVELQRLHLKITKLHQLDGRDLP
jgi:hypothetical protein